VLHPKASPRIRTSLAWILAPAVLIAAAASCDRQAPPGLDDAGLQPVFKGKPDPKIFVAEVDPPSAEQATSLRVRVLGRNFPGDDGEECTSPANDCIWAEFGIDEVVVPTNVKTTWTKKISSEELWADIEVGAEAEFGRYDAIVLRGSRGVGTEKFEVKVKPYSDIPLNITFEEASSYRLVSDGKGSYVDGEDPDLSAVIQSSGHLAFWTRQSPRAVRIYLGEPIGTPDPDLMPDLDTLAAGVHTWMVTQDPDIDSPTTPTDPKGFLKPDLDTLPFYVLWNAEDTTWGLFYGSTCESLNGVWDEDRDFVTIETSPDGWTLEAPSTSIEGNVWLCTMQVERRGKEKKDHPSPWTTVGRFDVPTLMTLDKLVGP